MDIFNGLDIFNIMFKVVAPAVTDDAEEDEESMDWWTKYFASIDTMIEVSLMKENKAFSCLLSSEILVQMMFKACCL